MNLGGLGKVIMSSKPAWTTQRISEQPELHSETLFGKQINSDVWKHICNHRSERQRQENLLELHPKFRASLSYVRACPEGQGEKGERKESNKITMIPFRQTECRFNMGLPTQRGV